LVSVFTDLGVDYEIIFVNDCSPDDSEEVIRQISSKDPRVVGITHSRNFGSQAAFRSGMEIASKEACVLLDGDLQDPPELIREFAKEWRAGADVVYGRRVRREMPGWLDSCYKGFYWIFSAVSEFPIPKNAGDFSLLDRKVVHWMLQCKEKDSFLRGIRAYVGFKQTFIEYDRDERSSGIGNYNRFTGSLKIGLNGLISFSTRPLFLMSISGFVLAGFSFLLGGWYVLQKLIGVNLTPGLSTTVLVITFFSGMQLLGLGLIGEYVGRIYDEVKRRPMSIVDKKINFEGHLNEKD
jgi:dolichol-phosphate mannosyltransferase